MFNEVYKISEIQNKLKLSHSSAYRFINNVYESQKPFKVIKLGAQFRIPKKTFDEWFNGEVYKVDEIQKMLKISRSCAYQFIQDVYKTQIPFRIIRIGNQYRISKESFDKWITGTSI